MYTHHYKHVLNLWMFFVMLIDLYLYLYTSETNKGKDRWVHVVVVVAALQSIGHAVDTEASVFIDRSHSAFLMVLPHV